MLNFDPLSANIDQTLALGLTPTTNRK